MITIIGIATVADLLSSRDDGGGGILLAGWKCIRQFFEGDPSLSDKTIVLRPRTRFPDCNRTGAVVVIAGGLIELEGGGKVPV